MSWTCPSCLETFKAQCYHACGLPKTAKAKGPLARVKNPQGRVDLLLARAIEQGMKQAKNPVLPALYQEVRPLIEQVLIANLGPRTARGRKLADQLFALKAAVDKVKAGRAA